MRDHACSRVSSSTYNLHPVEWRDTETPRESFKRINHFRRQSAGTREEERCGHREMIDRNETHEIHRSVHPSCELCINRKSFVTVLETRYRLISNSFQHFSYIYRYISLTSTPAQNPTRRQDFHGKSLSRALPTRRRTFASSTGSAM